MNQDLALQAVRKHKAKKTHLTVPASADADIRTLCGVALAAGEYDLIDGPADCQPCLRKKDNRAFISSAYFAQDAGSRLLEMSLQQARKGRAGRGATTPRGRRPDLHLVQPEADLRAPAAAERTPPAPGRNQTAGAADALNDDQLSALGLDALERVGPRVYRSPAGVLVRLDRAREGWRIAEVSFDGPASLSARTSGRTTVLIGDVRLEEAGDGLRLKVTSRRGGTRGRPLR